MPAYPPAGYPPGSNGAGFREMPRSAPAAGFESPRVPSVPGFRELSGPSEVPGVRDVGGLRDLSGLADLPSSREATATRDMPPIRETPPVPPMPAVTHAAEPEAQTRKGKSGLKGMLSGLKSMSGLADKLGEVPGVSDLAEKPSLSGLAKSAGLPEVPKLSDLPGVGDLPSLADARALAEKVGVDLPNLSDIPGVSDLAHLSESPGLSAVADLAKMPGVSKLPGMSTVAELAEFAEKPSFAGFAEVTGLSRVPGVSDAADLIDGVRDGSASLTDIASGVSHIAEAAGFSPPPGLEAAAGGIEAAANGFTAAVSGFEAAAGGVEAAANGFDAMSGGFSAAVSGFGAAAHGLGAVASGLGAAAHGFGAAVGGVEAAAGGLGAVVAGFESAAAPADVWAPPPLPTRPTLNTPTMPGSPAMPVSPAVPGFGEVPGLPRLPDLPSLPEMSGLADVSALDQSFGSFDDLGATGSVMSDLAFPAPFPVEQFEPPPFLVGEPGHASYERSDDRSGQGGDPVLPQRVPAVPDVPDLPLPYNDLLGDPAGNPIADRTELSRIATFLRDGNNDATDDRPDGFDLAAVISAVRSVSSVCDAQLRWTAGRGHTLRIDLVDGADAGEVTRQVARILRETLGIAAEPNPLTDLGVAPEESTFDRPITRRAPSNGAAVGSAPVPGRYARPDPRIDTGEFRFTSEHRTVGEHRSAIETRRGRPLPRPMGRDGQPATGSRVIVDHVQVTTLGVDATVEVRLSHPGGSAVGTGHGPAVDAYLLRLAATAAGDAIDQLLTDQGGVSRGRCFIEHAAVVPFAGCEVALVVLLLVCGGFSEQLCGAAIVSGDPRQAVVRATLSAVNRRLESLLG
jgi:hypothetical protein